ncbi:hypothetical protein VTL71DRAFT_10739 [Oculimacula yallundae]|uniref:Uncharacterized protein n=1 Tax=Oculimacula yallundae TaxID=86028 RepID=A0ABR4CTY8_9HELO
MRNEASLSSDGLISCHLICRDLEATRGSQHKSQTVSHQIDSKKTNSFPKGIKNRPIQLNYHVTGRSVRYPRFTTLRRDAGRKMKSRKTAPRQTKQKMSSPYPHVIRPQKATLVQDVDSSVVCAAPSRNQVPAVASADLTKPNMPCQGPLVGGNEYH